MTTNLPGTDLPDLREYLFVDAPRIRMLVSQLRGGAPESTTSTTSRSGRLRASLKILEGERSSQRSEEDTIVLSDLYVSMLEEDAEALGMLSDLSDRASMPKFWKRGGLRRSLEPGMLLRVHAPVRLMDASALVRLWRKFEAASDDDDEFTQMMTMVEALYGENLALTVMPCGPGEPANAFLGVIGHGAEFVALDRGSLLSRIGPETPKLTTILQVSRVPSERDNATSSEALISQIALQLREDGEQRLNRSLIDDFLMEMMRMTEDSGLQSAPRWPAVAVTPLAIYRQVPQTVHLDREERDQP